MKFNIILIIVVSLILAMTIRGLPGNPSPEDLNTSKWKDDGPFELSPERGRFALLYSLAENRSYFFSVPLAIFATPDLGYKNGHYVSLFAPAVSYLAIPGYLLGRTLGSSQAGAFAVIAVFAVFNFLLLRAIAVKLDINPYTAALGGIVFLFATPAFNYAATLYQHHISTFLILASLYLLLKWNNWWSTCLIWFLCAVSIPVDYPNLFLMLPVGTYVSGRLISAGLSRSGILKIKIRLSWWPTLLVILLPLVFFCWFNFRSYGNPWQFSGTIPDVWKIDAQGKPAQPVAVVPELQQKSSVSFFESRNILNGLYIHLFSPDRGIIFFTPVVMLGIVGGYFLYRRKPEITTVLIGIIGVNLILYSLWGDPWGGWAFGSRYLIPAYAILSLFAVVAVDRLKNNLFFIILFVLLFIYSAGVNTLGAITTSANPPQTGILALEKLTGHRELYSFDRNYEYLLNYGSKSYVYTAWVGKYLTAFQYYILLAGTPIILGLILLCFIYLYA